MRPDPTKLNRDFYIQMRLKGYTHETIVSNVFPPERYENFISDVKGLEEIDYSKKIDIDKLVGINKSTKKVNKKIIK